MTVSVGIYEVKWRDIAQMTLTDDQYTGLGERLASALNGWELDRTFIHRSQDGHVNVVVLPRIEDQNDPSFGRKVQTIVLQYVCELAKSN